MSEKKTYSASNIFRAEMGFGLDDMREMGKPTPITPEKLREVADKNATSGPFTEGMYRNQAVDALRAAADEVERLRGRKTPDAIVTRRELTDEEWDQQKRNMSDRPWINVADNPPPENQEVDTKIDDHNGLRNEQTLMRRGWIWFMPGGSSYVYYRPTHWRPLP